MNLLSNFPLCMSSFFLPFLVKYFNMQCLCLKQPVNTVVTVDSHRLLLYKEATKRIGFDHPRLCRPSVRIILVMDEGDNACEMSHPSSCGFCASWRSLAGVRNDAKYGCRETEDRWNREVTHLCGGRTGLHFYQYYRPSIPHLLFT